MRRDVLPLRLKNGRTTEMSGETKAWLKVFISYKWQDDERNVWVEQFYTDLRAKYGIDAQLDNYEVDLGESFTDYMTHRIGRECDAMLFIITPEAVRAIDESKSGGVHFEMQLATARRLREPGFRVIGIYREGDNNTEFLEAHRYADFRDDEKYRENLQALADSLLGRARKPTLGAQQSKENRAQAYDDQEKRNVLRNILGRVVPRMQTLMNLPDPIRENVEEVKKLHEQVEEIRPIFISNETVTKALTTIGNAAGTIVYRNQLPPERARRLPTDLLFDKFYENVEILKQALMAFEPPKAKASSATPTSSQIVVISPVKQIAPPSPDAIRTQISFCCDPPLDANLSEVQDAASNSAFQVIFPNDYGLGINAPFPLKQAFVEKKPSSILYQSEIPEQMKQYSGIECQEYLLLNTDGSFHSIQLYKRPNEQEKFFDIELFIKNIYYTMKFGCCWLDQLAGQLSHKVKEIILNVFASIPVGTRLLDLSGFAEPEMQVASFDSEEELTRRFALDPSVCSDDPQMVERVVRVADFVLNGFEYTDISSGWRGFGKISDQAQRMVGLLGRNIRDDEISH